MTLGRTDLRQGLTPGPADTAPVRQPVQSQTGIAIEGRTDYNQAVLEAQRAQDRYSADLARAEESQREYARNYYGRTDYEQDLGEFNRAQERAQEDYRKSEISRIQLNRVLAANPEALKGIRFSRNVLGANIQLHRAYAAQGQAEIAARDRTQTLLTGLSKDAANQFTPFYWATQPEARQMSAAELAANSALDLALIIPFAGGVARSARASRFSSTVERANAQRLQRRIKESTIPPREEIVRTIRQRAGRAEARRADDGLKELDKGLRTADERKIYAGAEKLRQSAREAKLDSVGTRAKAIRDNAGPIAVHQQRAKLSTGTVNHIKAVIDRIPSRTKATGQVQSQASTSIPGTRQGRAVGYGLVDMPVEGTIRLYRGTQIGAEQTGPRFYTTSLREAEYYARAVGDKPLILSVDLPAGSKVGRQVLRDARRLHSTGLSELKVKMNSGGDLTAAERKKLKDIAQREGIRYGSSGSVNVRTRLLGKKAQEYQRLEPGPFNVDEARSALQRSELQRLTAAREEYQAEKARLGKQPSQRGYVRVPGGQARPKTSATAKTGRQVQIAERPKVDLRSLQAAEIGKKATEKRAIREAFEILKKSQKRGRRRAKQGERQREKYRAARESTKPDVKQKRARGEARAARRTASEQTRQLREQTAKAGPKVQQRAATKGAAAEQQATRVRTQLLEQPQPKPQTIPVQRPEPSTKGVASPAPQVQQAEQTAASAREQQKAVTEPSAKSATKPTEQPRQSTTPEPEQKLRLEPAPEPAPKIKIETKITPEPKTKPTPEPPPKRKPERVQRPRIQRNRDGSTTVELPEGPPGKRYPAIVALRQGNTEERVRVSGPVEFAAELSDVVTNNPKAKPWNTVVVEKYGKVPLNRDVRLGVVKQEFRGRKLTFRPRRETSYRVKP